MLLDLLLFSEARFICFGAWTELDGRIGIFSVVVDPGPAASPVVCLNKIVVP